MNKATLGNEVAKLTLLNTFGLPDGKASRAEAVGDHLRLAGRLDPLRHHPHDPDGRIRLHRPQHRIFETI